MKRNIFTDEHKIFRTGFQKFVQSEILPYFEQWEKDRIVSREVWEKAGEQGFLCMDIPEAYGGEGVQDYRYNAIINEELARVRATSVVFGLHTDIVVPYLFHYGTDLQKERWLPKMVQGKCITAIAMTEPNTGSDLGGVQTTAIRQGDYYLLNGQKTFISNGLLNDLVIVVAKTDTSQGHHGISLLVVERGMEGYERGKNLLKIGMHAQDTSELFFHNVKVPVENLLGEEGKGFIYLMQQLPQERLMISVGALASAEASLERTIQYCQERKAFGQSIGKFQNTRFKLAELKTEIKIGQAFLDRCIMAHNEKELTTEDAAMAKWWITELLKKVVDQCLQLYGGYGYILEYPIAKDYVDARAQTIFGGTTEIMKDIISRKMGF